MEERTKYVKVKMKRNRKGTHSFDEAEMGSISWDNENDVQSLLKPYYLD